MSQVKTNSYKCPIRKSWVAKSSVASGNDYELTLRTSKTSSGRLVSSVTRVKIEGNVTSFMMFQDFSKTYIQSDVRVTEKVVLSQHDSLLAQLDQIKSDCEEFYNKK